MIKCACIGFDDKAFYFEHISGQKPIMGTVYTLEDATEGTAAQNKAFHSLLDAFYNWMLHINNFQFEDNNILYDFRCSCADDFRENFKYKYGEGATHYQYSDDDHNIIKADSLDDIPEHICLDRKALHKSRIKAVLKSWTKYTKVQRKRAIDRLFDIIKTVNCQDKRVLEIMGGMQGD